mgnify:CR=1 FL=1
MEKIKIIIADDIQAIVESNKRIVASFDNVEVIGTAYIGQDEYDMIINLQPDLVITDNQMPIMNGKKGMKLKNRWNWIKYSICKCCKPQFKPSIEN